MEFYVWQAANLSVTLFQVMSFHACSSVKHFIISVTMLEVAMFAAQP